MNMEIFSKNFEFLADAPNSVQKLREVILQLAVQGKLVAQDPGDDPAAVLLEKIRGEKEKIIKEKKLKNINTLPVTESEKNAIELPEGWQFIKLGEIVQKLGAGSTPKGGKAIYQEAGIKFIRSQNVWNNGLSLQNVAYIPLKIHKRMNGTVVEPGDILLNITGASIGRSALVPDDFDEGNVSQHVAIIRLIDNSLRYYLHLYLISPFIKNRIMDVQVGISREGLSMSRLKDFLILIPPLSEANRIVAKVDQLMALCDQLEARQQKKHEQRILLNNAALDKLLTAPTPEEFAQHWQRICDNFNLLYDAPETVGHLRQAILQLAVQGKLVAQDPGDEPAAVLLEKATAEKERLIKEGIIRKPKPLSSNDLENPYKLPLNWKWTRLFDIGLINPRNVAKDDMEASFIPMTLISETYSIPISSERRLWGEIKSGFTHFAEEDVVLAKITPCFQNGKSAVMRNLLNGFGAGTTELHVFRPLLDESVNPDYVLLYLRSPQFLKEGIERMTGTAGQKRVPRDYFAGNPFPLPPFEEQKRIVAKVDQLMALCDELEARLVQTQTDGGKLMEAVVHHVLAE